MNEGGFDATAQNLTRLCDVTPTEREPHTHSIRGTPPRIELILWACTDSA